ncbi:hypothetical protein P7C70_g6489, partial [Phenoliferia sp. Uapishka_3]
SAHLAPSAHAPLNTSASSPRSPMSRNLFQPSRRQQKREERDAHLPYSKSRGEAPDVILPSIDLGGSRKLTGAEANRWRDQQPEEAPVRFVTEEADVDEDRRQRQRSESFGGDDSNDYGTHDEDEEDEPLPSHGSTFLPAHLFTPIPRLRTQYDLKLEARAMRWEQLRPLLFAIYSHRKAATQNSTNEHADADFGACTFKCAATSRRPPRPILLVQSHRQDSRLVNFCGCKNDSLRLLAMGYVASSPDVPTTAFSVVLLEEFMATWRVAPVSMTGWIEGKWEFHRERLGVLSGLGSMQEKDPGGAFREAVRVYRDLQLLEQKLISITLSETERDVQAKRCPACFGPRVDEPLGPASALLCIDGNFQHYRKATAAKYDYRHHRYPLFLPQRYMDEAKAKVAATEAHKALDDEACSDSWTAKDDGNPDGIYSGKIDSGLMACVCRHDACMSMINLIKSGEKLYYAIAFIEYFMTDVDPTGSLKIFYDVGCNLFAHCRKRKIFVPEIASGRLGIALAVFHAFAHNWLCQMSFNPRFLLGFGLTDGEGTERFWSFLSRLVSLNRRASSSLRLSNIQTRADYHNTKHRLGLVVWLKRKARTTVTRANTARVGLQLAATHGWSNSNLQAQWKAQQEDSLPSRNRDVAKETKAKSKKLGALLLLQDDLTAATGVLQNAINTASDSVVNAITALVALAKRKTALTEDIDAAKLGVADTERNNDLQKVLRKLTSPTANISTAVTIYDKCVALYIQKYSPNPPPRYARSADHILKLDLGDPFFSDTTFHEAPAPWRANQYCRDGITWLLQSERCAEEDPRISCEVRRIVYWASQQTASLALRVTRWEDALRAWNRWEERIAVDGEEEVVAPALPLDLEGLLHLPPGAICEVVLNALRDEQKRHRRLERQWIADGLLRLWDVQLGGKPRSIELLGIMSRVYKEYGMEVVAQEASEDEEREAQEEGDEYAGAEGDDIDAALALARLNVD